MLQEFSDAAALGTACRQVRRRLKLTLEEAAMAAGVNYRFASELENGKPTAQIDLALRYANALGVRLFCALPADGDDPAMEHTVLKP